jgi:two-component system LytT family response regulator
MKLLLIDNEKNTRRGLRELLLLVSAETPIIEEADGVESGLQKIKNFSPDIVFLDIEMDDGTGFDLLNRIPHPSFQLVFTTAHDQYAIQAFKFSAIDYLLKPVDPDELSKSLERAAASIRNNDLNKQLSILMQQLSHKSDHERKIVLKDIDSTYFIRVNDILFCQAEGTYTKFYITNNDPILVSKNLKVFDKTDGGSLILEGDIRIPISQRKRDVVLGILEKKV